MTTLKLTLIVLPIIEIAIFVLLIIFKDRKKKVKDPVLHDNAQVYCEDFEAIFYDP